MSRGMPRVRRRDAVAARLARRDVLAHRWRSLLIVLLVALPVAAVVGGATLAQSTQPTRAEWATRHLGAAEAQLTWLATDEAGRGCEQAMIGLGAVACDATGGFTVADRPATLAAALPGRRTAEVASGALEVRRVLRDGGTLPLQVPVTVVDFGDATHTGRWDLVAGRAASGSEVVVSRPWLTRFGVGLGGEVVTDRGSYRIAGVVAAPELKGAELFLPPGHPESGAATEPAVLVADGPAVSWEDVRALNRRGVQVLSRAVLEEIQADGWVRDPSSTIALVAVFGAMAGVLTTFVAGSAFAVGVRAQRRQLGLLGAVGADAGVLRRVVLGQGVVLGGLGGVIGVAAGLASAAVITRYLASRDLVAIYGWHVPWPVVAGAAGLGLMACLVAAWGPAHTVLRVDALEAVRTAEAAVGPARFPILGLAVTAVGVALAGAAVAWSRVTDPERWYEIQIPLLALLAAVAVVLLAGVAWSLHALVALVARVVPRRPLALRLAIRDVDRSRPRVVPAVAAVMTAVALATVVMAINAGQLADQRERRAWRMHPTQASVVLNGAQPAAALEVATRTIGTPRASTVLSSVAAFPLTPEENHCPRTRQGRLIDPADWRCVEDHRRGSYPAMVVGGAAELALLLDRTPTAAETGALASGQVVTSWRPAVANGRMRVELLTDGNQPEPMDAPPGVDVPALLAPVAQAPGWSIVAPAVAASWGAEPTSGDLLVVDFGRTPTGDELDRLEAAWHDLNLVGVTLPRDPARADAPLGWIAVAVVSALTLAVVGLVTALGVTDARRDEATLAAVGAPPGLRRATTAGQVAVVAGLGAVLGVAVGLGLVWVLGAATLPSSLWLVPPWAESAALIGGLPLVGALGAWVLTPPSRVVAQRAG